MRILYVITGLAMGGAEHVVVSLADALVARGHQVKIAYLTGEALVLPQNPNVEVIAIGMKGSQDFLKAYFRLRSLVKIFKPDVVHSHMVHANLITRLLKLTVSVPKLVNTAHNTNEGSSLRTFAYRITDSLTNHFTNVSKDAVDSSIKKGAVNKNRIISIPNGIDTDTFYFDRLAREKKRTDLNLENKKMLLIVGSLSKQKDYPNLLNSIAILVRNRQDFKVFIVGEGPLEEELKNLKITLNLQGYVEFLGMRRDIRDLMSATDIYVMSSAWEGLPIVILEAMACERLIVATDCGGVNEAIGSHGFLVDSKNSSLLAQELNRALELSDIERAEIGTAARQRIVDKFSLDANVDAYLKLYTV